MTLPLAGCSNTSDSPAQANTSIEGELAVSAYGLTSPSVVAQNEKGAFFVSAVGPDGRFTLSVPGDEVYRLSIVRATLGGAFVPVSRIRLPVGKSMWARFDAHAQIDLGVIRPSELDAAGVGIQKDRGSEHAEDDDGGALETGDGQRDGGVRGDDVDGSDDHGGSNSGHDEDGSGGDDDDRDAESSGDDDGHDCARACVPGQNRDADLPYDVKLSVGDSFQLSDAFLEKGPKPAGIVRVTMQGEPYHLSELEQDTPFVITDADCSHQGNRDQGRDRVFVTWQNADGSLETDHLDLRYCEGDAGDRVKSADERADDEDDECAPGDEPSPVCHEDASTPTSDCHGGSSKHMESADEPAEDPEPTCDPTTPPGGGEPPPAVDPPPPPVLL